MLFVSPSLHWTAQNQRQVCPPHGDGHPLLLRSHECTQLDPSGPGGRGGHQAGQGLLARSEAPILAHGPQTRHEEGGQKGT